MYVNVTITLNISVVICGTGIPWRLTESLWRPDNFRNEDIRLTTRRPPLLAFTLYHNRKHKVSSCWNVATCKWKICSGFRVTRSLVLYVCFLLIVVCPFVLFLLAIMLSVLLWYMDSDCPIGIFKLFFTMSLSFILNRPSLWISRDRPGINQT